MQKRFIINESQPQKQNQNNDFNQNVEVVEQTLNLSDKLNHGQNSCIADENQNSQNKEPID